jgi:predicted RNA binding protein YcfA (HicA-like mRNA interferase family)
LPPMKPEKLLSRILAGAVRNVDFDDLIGLLQGLGFKEFGGRGSHRVFVRAGVAEILTLQQVRGQAKPYQVRQVVALIRQYNLDLEGEP